jgi:secreted PhoX family phosphatase
MRQEKFDMSKNHEPIDNLSNNPHFQDVLNEGLRGVNRRSILRGGVGLATLMGLPMLPGFATTTGLPALPASRVLGFPSVGKSLLDQVAVPAGYTVKVLHATGDPLAPTVPAYSNTGAETDDWSKRVGDHHDGMHLFYIGRNGKVSMTATTQAVIAINHESSADAHFLHPTGQTSNGVSGKKFDQFGRWDLGTRPGLEVLKEINLHGVSLAEVTMDSKGLPAGYKVDSALNRRITPQTVVDVKGPAAHLSDIRTLLATKFDASGATARGTLNNCGYGYTPWGTYLACEENWAAYFNMPTASALPDAKILAARKRYGVASAALTSASKLGASQGWYTPTDLPDTDGRFSRWNIAASGASAAEDYRQEPHTFGYNLEIDPANPASRPAKRVAMGRFAHEAAVCGLPVAGQPLAFYMGCDSRNEYIYKFVTTAVWDPADFGGGIAAGDKYLNEGKLYVAKFNSDGNGQWIELNISNPLISGYASASFSGFRFTTQADVFVFTRLAADAVGATKMDRPEWGAVNPANGEVYFALTNNSNTNRTPATADAANPRSYNDADGKKSSGNPNGHIIRFREAASSPVASTFRWDIFAFGAEEDAPANVNISGLTANNSFSSPDGLWFSKSTGVLWIQTDDGAFTDETNCMLLAAVPGSVGDGGEFVVGNNLTVSSGTTNGETRTFVGGLLGESRLRRFLVAPKGSEVTGLTETADGKALLVNIQHPGENTSAADFTANKFESQWPGNGGGLSSGGYGVAGRPRSATLIITKNDGGRVGL